MAHRPTHRRAGADQASMVVAGALPMLRPGERPLIVDDPTQQLVDALSPQGVTAHTWLRRVAGSRSAAAWPAPGPFTSAFVRLPKSKDALDFSLHAATSVVPAGAQVVVFGANDEGIQSAAAHLDNVAEGIVTVDTRRHCRVLMGLRRAVIAGHKTALSEWRRETQITIAGTLRRWVTYPGLFAGGGLDDGTALLLSHLPDLAASARVLDFGCGTGVIAAGVLQQHPGVRCDLMDADALALEAARENVADARLLAGEDLAAANTRGYDAILSNPPIHDGVAEHHGTLERLIAEAPSYLRRGGVLQIVVQRRVKAAERIQAAFDNVEVVAETGRYRVLRSRKAD